MATPIVKTGPRPTRTPGLWSAVKTLHRVEVGPIYFFVLVWGMFAAADQPQDLWTPASLLALFINGLSLFSGFVLNAYSDYPIDRRSVLKGHVADAVERVGLRATWLLYWTEQAATVAAAVAVSVMLDNWSFVFVKLLGIVAGIVYNAEPMRAKRRGIWNPVLLSVRFGFVPGLIAYLAVHHGSIGFGGWVLLAGMTLISFSRGFWNAVSDTDEDRAENIGTPAVRYGPRRAMQAAVAALVPACVLVAGGLWLLFGPVWALVGVSGIAGATVYRYLLLSRVDDDPTAVSLLCGPVRRLDGTWTQATYWAVTAAGLGHMIVTVVG